MALGLAGYLLAVGFDDAPVILSPDVGGMVSRLLRKPSGDDAL